mgnify:CR=1 FL=1
MRAVLCPPTVYVSALDDDAHGTAGAADHAAGSFQRSSVQVGHLGLSDLFHLSGGQSSDLSLLGLPEAVLMPAAFLIRTAAGGVLVMKLKERSA